MIKKDLDLIALGELLIDFTPGDEPASYIANAGGAVANVAVAAAKAGLRAGFIGTVGDDDFGRYLIKTMQNNDVEMIVDTPVDSAFTTLAFVSLNEGERSFAFARKPGADMMLDKLHIRREDIARAKLIDFGSISLTNEPCYSATLRAFELAKELGVKVAMDVNYRAPFWKSIQDCVDKIFSVLHYVNYLKISDEEIAMFGGEEALGELMNKYDIEFVALTYGDKGTRVVTKSGTIINEPAFPARKVVDTTGAGDAFWGNFLAYLIRSDFDTSQTSIENAARIGNAAGSISVTKKGGVPSLPILAESKALMQSATKDKS